MNQLKEDILALFNKGVSKKQIVKILGASSSTVFKYTRKGDSEIEQKVLELRKQLKSVNEISRILKISKTTVSLYISNENVLIKNLTKEKARLNQIVGIKELELRREQRNKDREIPSCKNTVINRKLKRMMKKDILVRLSGGKCCNCGFDIYVGVMHFHHIDKSLKLFSLHSNDLSRPVNELINEVNKCALLCSNCHGIIHADETLRKVPIVNLIRCNIKLSDWPDNFNSY
jgi:DNA-binding CsgD family transcriptional regulator/5-methylcytosine-specific restriction endonuclease McrA